MCGGGSPSHHERHARVFVAAARVLIISYHEYNKLSRVTCHCHEYHVYFSGRGGREGDGLDQESICSTGSRGEKENIVNIST